MRKFLIILTLGMFSLGIAQAATFHFTKITSNNAEDLGMQLTVEVTIPTAGQAAFKFTNDGDGGLIRSIATQAYFDSDLFIGILNITTTTPFSNPVGVSFGETNQTNLPGGNPIGFFGDLSAIRTNGQGGVKRGINNLAHPDQPGILEDLTVFISLSGTPTLDQLIANMRVGLHVQEIGVDGDSDSYVNLRPPSPPNLVPEPGSLILLGSGLLVGGLLSLKRKRYN